MHCYDVGAYKRTITTYADHAQLWFDRGLNWTYGFNHGEAIKCFEKALEYDPNCAMAYWGIAYAAGPNYNLPWQLYDPDGKAKALATAYDAMQAALSNADGVSAIEADLIRALPFRYPQREAVEDQCQRRRDFAAVGRSKSAVVMLARRPPDIGGPSCLSRLIPQWWVPVVAWIWSGVTGSCFEQGGSYRRSSQGCGRGA